jgi:ParB family chromosome partitioning protein
VKATAAAKKPKVVRAPRPATSEPLPVRHVPIDQIDPSPRNRTARNVEDLVESVREHGIQQAVKLRPKGERFEIVYGERRYRAAMAVGLKEVPATVEALSDEEAHELRIVENACREDPHPLEEAEAYEALLAMKDGRGRRMHTADTLAKLVGRSPSYVYTRLKLTALGTGMREAFWKGQLTATTALLVARAVPPALQDEALTALRDELDDPGEGEPFPAEDVADLVEQRYLTRLDRAPFSTGDAKLFPEAGACTKCPKRSGNQPRLFADETAADTCTDLLCFRKKLAAHQERLANEVRASGGAVLTEHQSSTVFQGSRQLPWNSSYVDLDATCFEDPERRTWRRLLGDLCPAQTLASDAGGLPHALVGKAAAVKALAEAGVDFVRRQEPTAKGEEANASPATPGARAQPSQTPADPAAAKAAAELRRATTTNLLSAVVAAAQTRPPEDSTFARHVLDAMVHGGYHDAVVDAVKRRGLEREKGLAPEAVLKAHAAELDGPGIRALVLELAVGRGAYFAWSSRYSDRLTAAAAAYGIDVAAVEKATEEELEQRRAERGAPKPRKSASAS